MRRLRAIFPKGAQAAQIAGADLCGVFHFTGVEPEGAVQEEVDLIPGLSLTVGQMMFSVQGVAPGTHVLCNETFQGGAIDLGSRIQRPGGTISTKDPRIEKEELRMRRQRPWQRGETWVEAGV